MSYQEADEQAVIEAWRTLDRIMGAEAELLPAYNKKELKKAESEVRKQKLGHLAPVEPAPA